MGKKLEDSCLKHNDLAVGGWGVGLKVWGIIKEGLKG